MTLDELILSFGATTEEAIRDVEAVFKEVDYDGGGTITFSEWIVASIDKESLLTEEKLIKAFNLFDADGGGTIDIVEVKRTL